MSNYPEGVTGNEHQIVGGIDRTDMIVGACSNCEFHDDVEAEVTYFEDDGLDWAEWVCPQCSHKNTYEHYPVFDYVDMSDDRF